jgi:peroxiredoxin
MQLNYFGSLRLIMGFLPSMIDSGGGHIINISSIGVLTRAPRFSAYVASKAALDAFSDCAASEFIDNNVHFTTINMPLVKTPMIAPTQLYNHVPTLTPEQAADLVVEAIVYRPVRIATRLGIFGEILHAVAPKATQIILNTAFRMFPTRAPPRAGRRTASPRRSSSRPSRSRSPRSRRASTGRRNPMATPLKAGDPAPDFEGVTTGGERVSLKGYRGRKLVMYFYPKDDTPGCTKQACSLRDHDREIAAKGAAILGVSTQDEESHRAFTKKFNLNFPLLADSDGAVGRAYGVLGGPGIISKLKSPPDSPTASPS